jgi:hypothetical protein
MCLKSFCNRGSPSTKSPERKSRSSYFDSGTALDRRRQCVVLFEENHLNEPLLRLPLRFDPRLRVDLDCKAGAGMAHEFLHDLYVLSIPDQQR